MSKIYKNPSQKSTALEQSLKRASSPKETLTKDSRLENKQTLRSSSLKYSHNQFKDHNETLKSALNRNITSSVKADSFNDTRIAEKTQVLDPIDKSSKINTAETNLNKTDLQKIFNQFGIFPNKHRGLIWKYLLRLPYNKKAFNNLINRDIHIAFKGLQKDFEIPSRDLFIKLQRILSSLAYSSPIFSEVDYLPDLVYPFVKLFAGDELLCYEIIISFFFHWGQHFFQYFPNPPLTLIQTTEELLKFHEPDLYNHFKAIDVNMVDYVWPFLKYLFTTLLGKDEWLSLMDFLVLYKEEPVYLLFFVVSYLSYFKDPLLKVKSREDIEHFLQKQNPVNIQTIIRDMRYYKKNTPHSQILVKFRNNLPIEGEEYPAFTSYPEYAVEYHRRVREQFLADEKKLETKKESIKQIQNLTNELLDQERKFRDKQEALVKAQKDRKNTLMMEEERKFKQKLALETQSRERRLSQLQNLEKSIRCSLQQQEKLSKEELEELEKDLELQSRIDRQFVQSRVEEEALLSLEFQAAQRLHQISELRNTEERARKIRTEIDYMEKQNKLKDRTWEENLRAEDEEFRLKMEVLRQQKLSELQKIQEMNDKKELELKLLSEDLKRELKLRDVERERKLRTIAQEGVLENEKYMTLNKMREEAKRIEEENYMKSILKEEEINAMRKTEERLKQIELEKRVLRDEINNYERTLQERSLNQKREEFENRVAALKTQKELKLIEEEKELQKEILDIEEKRKVQREMQRELSKKEQEYQEKVQLYRTLRADDENMINEERDKLADFRRIIKEESEKAEQVRERMAEARLTQIQQRNQEMIQQNNEELRRKIQQENMSKYMEKFRNSEQQSESESESESSMRESNQRSLRSREERGEDLQAEDSRRRGYESQRTGAFQSQEESTNKFGRSTSSYTYSETANEDNLRPSRSQLAEAQDLITRHNNMRSLYDSDYRYNQNEYGNQQMSRDMYTSTSRVDEEYTSGGESQERYYKAPIDGVTRSQQLKSSPDNNLTYSSYEGSVQ